ncbi:hypothetical protein [Streptomyces diastaticus]|uniref:hypothetical protein n=1 Tax=Streptomyces diastaticus TaxID=1956 RepID=UPI003658A32C
MEPYDHTWKNPGGITTEDLRSQAAEMGLAGVDVILLTPASRPATPPPSGRSPTPC